MGKSVAQSKNNTARRSMQRNQGLPNGVHRTGKFNSMPNMDRFLLNAKSLFDLERRSKLLRRWKCSFGRFPEDLKYMGK